MFRRILALGSFAVLVSAAALAQAVPPLVTSTPITRPVFLSLDAVQNQVDGILSHAAASKHVIDVAVARPSLPLLPSTPIPRR